MNTLHRIRPALKVNLVRTPAVLTLAHAVDNGMEKDPVLFATPQPALVIFKAQIAKLDTAQQLAATRAKGAAAARDVERRLMVGMLETQCSYVQTLCDAMPDKAIAIIEAVGMSVALTPVRAYPILKVTVGLPSGTVDLAASVSVLVGKTGTKTFFNWQFTTDGGKTFNNAPSTPHASTTITGLTPLTTVGFRVSVTTRKGIGEWSQVVSILVL